MQPKRKESSTKDDFTDDGFKIVGSIPEDDSDISDAFQSDEEEFTSDGFRLRSDIPSDDSDVSDAFGDSEGEDDEDLERASQTKTKMKIENQTSEESLESQKEPGFEEKASVIRNSIRRMIEDFGECE